MGAYLWERLQGSELDIKTLWVPFQKTLYGANVIIFEGIMAFADKTLLEVRACREHPLHRHPHKYSLSNTPPHPHSLYDLRFLPIGQFWMRPTWCILGIYSRSLPPRGAAAGLSYSTPGVGKDCLPAWLGDRWPGALCRCWKCLHLCRLLWSLT